MYTDADGLVHLKKEQKKRSWLKKKVTMIILLKS